MVIIVHKMNSSPPARAVLMTIEILGLKVETIEVDTHTEGQYKPEYLKKNPTHTVPMIEDGDFVLADSHAIITYMVSKYGTDLSATLYPDDLKARATIDHRLFVDATIVFPLVKSIVISVLKDKAAGPSAQQVKEVLEAYGYIEKYLEKTAFLAGDHITVADISVVSSISSLDALVPLDDKFLKIREWWEKIQAKEWYQKANVPGLTQFAGLLKSTMKQNAKST